MESPQNYDCSNSPNGQENNNHHQQQPSGSSGSPSPPPPVEFHSAPNRKGFEQRIWQVNNKLDKLQEQIKNYWNEQRRTQFGALKDQMDEEKRVYGVESEDEIHLTQTLKDIDDQLQQKQREIHELEESPDLVYKSLPMAKQKLAQLESQFKERRFTNIRDEQLWVAQMDKLQRNITRLAKYTPLMERKREMEADGREQRRRIREIRQKMRRHKEQAAECRHKLWELQRPFRQLKEEFAKMRDEKKALIERYNSHREHYRKWRMREERTRNFQHGTASFPTTTDHMQDADSMELFHCQKQACIRLITYLQGLKQFAEHRVDGAGGKEKEKETPKQEEVEEDSADELPESFHRHFGLSKSQKGRDKLCEDVRKLAKKQAMPLSHGLDWIRLFGEIDVPPPRTHADVPNALREVQAALAFYEAQTSEQHEEEDGNDNNDMGNGQQQHCPDRPMMSLSGYSSLASPCASSSLLSPTSLGSYSPRLSFVLHHPPPNTIPPQLAKEKTWTTEEEESHNQQCTSSSAESSIGPSL